MPKKTVKTPFDLEKAKAGIPFYLDKDDNSKNIFVGLTPEGNIAFSYISELKTEEVAKRPPNFFKKAFHVEEVTEKFAMMFKPDYDKLIENIEEIRKEISERPNPEDYVILRVEEVTPGV